MGGWKQIRRTAGLAFGALALGAGCNEGPSFQTGNRYAAVSNLDANPVQSETFEASIIQNRLLEWDASSSSVHESFNLVKGPKQTLSLTQVERQEFMDSFVQGGDGAEINQSFQVKEAGHLDLLLVVDNSDTMKEHQLKLATKLGPILSKISNTNWRIAVVTTDNPCALDVMTRQDYETDAAALQQRFVDAVSVKPGKQGSPVERGIQMAIEGFQTNGSCGTVAGFSRNQWTRPSSSKVVLIVSDEENCGSAINDGCPTNGYFHHTPDYFMTNGPSGARVFGILPNWNPSRGPLCTADYDQPAKEEYIELVGKTGGQYTSICDEDFTPILMLMSADVGQIIHRDFTLDAVPDADTLQVKVDGVKLTSGYTLNGKRVVVEGSAVSTNSVMISFSYVAGTQPRTDTIALNEFPDPETFEVLVDDQPVEKAKYKYDKEQNAIVFKKMPPDRKVVKVKYRVDEELPKRFQLPEGAARAGVAVNVQGKGLGAGAFNVDESGNVVMAAAPEDGAEILLEYYANDALKTEYRLDPALVEFSSNVEITVDGATLPSLSVQGADLSIDAEDVAGHELVEVVYSFLNPDEFRNITLPQEAIQVEWAMGNDQRPDLQCEQVSLREEKVLDLSCYVTKYASFSANYQVVVERLSQFELKRKVTDPTSVVVTVDGKPFSAFELQGQILSIDRSIVGDLSRISVQYN
jgi:hypothetical protein